MSAPRNAMTGDAEACARLVRHHARTFAAASHFLPAPKRRAAFAVYAFCRIADDMVDEAMRGSAEAARDLDNHHAAFVLALRGSPANAYFRELVSAMRTYGIPEAPFVALLDMLRTDLQPVEYTTWPELERYCGGVASTVGEMCAHVFGMPASATARAEALWCARTLGVALQLTNILRDVGEDAVRGRCYLPTEDLSRFEIERSEILSRSIGARDPRWLALMQFEIARTRALYVAAAPGMAILHTDSQCCARICASGYAGILDAIERRHYDTLSGRAHIGTLRKLAVMASAWLTTRRQRSTHAPTRAAPVSGIAGEVHRGIRSDSRSESRNEGRRILRSERAGRQDSPHASLNNEPHEHRHAH